MRREWNSQKLGQINFMKQWVNGDREEEDELTIWILEFALEIALDLVARKWELKSPLKSPFLDLSKIRRKWEGMRVEWEVLGNKKTC